MSEQTLTPQTAPSTAFLAGFQTEGRTREPQVEAQVQTLLRVPRPLFWQQARQSDRKTPTWVQEETLVCMLRVWNRSPHTADKETAWDIADLLIERSARFIHQHVSCWKLSPQHVEDCKRDVQVQMLQDLFNDSRGCEFWEVRFWLCLKRRLLNIVQKYRGVAEAEFAPNPIEDDEGHATDYFDKVAAGNQLSAHERVEVREALRALPEQERRAFVLYHYEDWSQEQIAEALQITARTVRNLLARAQKRLEAWRAEQAH